MFTTVMIHIPSKIIINNLYLLLLPITIKLGSPTSAFKSYCPITFRCIPVPTHLTQMTELPLQHVTKFGKGFLVKHSFESEICLKIAEQLFSRIEVENPDAEVYYVMINQNEKSHKQIKTKKRNANSKHHNNTLEIMLLINKK